MSEVQEGVGCVFVVSHHSFARTPMQRLYRNGGFVSRWLNGVVRLLLCMFCFTRVSLPRNVGGFPSFLLTNLDCMCGMMLCGVRSTCFYVMT